MTTSDIGTKPADGTSDRLHEASERVIEVKDEAIRSLESRVAALGALMHEHPIASLGVGLALGVLIARIIHRGP